MKMCRDLGDYRYMFWAATSLLEQGEVEQRSLSIDLAEKVLQKLRDEKRITTPHELKLCVEVLTNRGKLPEAVQLLEEGVSPGLWTTQREAHTHKASLLLAMHSWAQARTTFHALLLQHDLDEFSWWKSYIECSMKIDDIDGVRALLADSQLSHPTLRAPALASLHLELSIFESSNEETDKQRAYESLWTCIVRFFGQFGHKPNCAVDLRAFLDVVRSRMSRDPAAVAEMRTQLESPLPSIPEGAKYSRDHPPAKTDTDALSRHVTSLKILRYLGIDNAQSSTSSATSSTNSTQQALNPRNSVQQLIEQWHGTLCLSAEREDKWRSYSDDLMLLAAQSLTHSAYSSESTHECEVQLLAAAAVCEAGLKESGTNFELLLMGCTVYTNLGCASECLSHFNTLRVRNIQVCTLSHHVTPLVLYAGLYDDAINMWTEIVRFVTEHKRENSDMVTSAYRNGTYTQVVPFVRFLKRLESSSVYLLSLLFLHQFRLLRLEHIAADKHTSPQYKQHVTLIREAFQLTHQIASNVLSRHGLIQDANNKTSKPSDAIGSTNDYAPLVSWHNDATASPPSSDLDVSQDIFSKCVRPPVAHLTFFSKAHITAKALWLRLVSVACYPDVVSDKDKEIEGGCLPWLLEQWLAVVNVAGLGGAEGGFQNELVLAQAAALRACAAVRGSTDAFSLAAAAPHVTECTKHLEHAIASAVTSLPSQTLYARLQALSTCVREGISAVSLLLLHALFPSVPPQPKTPKPNKQNKSTPSSTTTPSSTSNSGESAFRESVQSLHLALTRCTDMLREAFQKYPETAQVDEGWRQALGIAAVHVDRVSDNVQASWRLSVESMGAELDHVMARLGRGL
eukprot:c12885_g1_i2.p1 GENE.c12885_g1_i2~~c12885_g1_i2.p1  ORF type:complete len:993 (+),score=286.58 c12885_g1_i2:425-2980(+)